MFTSQALARFAEQYANWSGLKTICLTFDTDFAPDYMIGNVIHLLEKYNARATFFATHPSQALINLAGDERYEIATHPNLTPNTTQGRDLQDIIVRLKNTYPGIIGNRFHILSYSYRDLQVLGRDGFRYDVSTLRFNCPYLLPAWHADLNMLLLTYTWEDGICENAGLPMRLDSIDLHSPGLKIINFHPMNIYINGRDASARLTFLKENPDLLNCAMDAAGKYRCSGDGAEKVLVDLLDFLSSNSCQMLRVRDILSAYEKVMAAESTASGA